MGNNKRYIPNPNKLSQTEKAFLSNPIKAESGDDKQIVQKADLYKGRMISMSDSFFERLNNYLKENPTEGNRSSFIVRIIAEYLHNKGW